MQSHAVWQGACAHLVVQNARTSPVEAPSKQETPVKDAEFVVHVKLVLVTAHRDAGGAQAVDVRALPRRGWREGSVQ